MRKISFQPGRKFFAAVLSIAVLFAGAIGYTYFSNAQLQTIFQRSSPHTVLGADTAPGLPDNLFKVNFPTEFTNTVTFDKNALLNGDVDIKGKATFEQGLQTNNQDIVTGTGQIIAPNVLYGITAGTGIGVSSGQTPTITNTGVTSLQGATGAVTLTAGDGISISGTTISSTAGSDTGSAQNIFKNILVSGQDTITAGNNNDSLEFVAGTGIVLTTNAGSKQISISSTGSGGSTQWTTAGNDIYYTTGNVGIGTTTPLYPLDVTGDAHVSGNLVLGSQSVNNLTGNGLALTGGTLGIDLPVIGGTTSTNGSFSGLEFTGNQLTLLQGCGDTQLLKWNATDKEWECSDDAGGATGVVNIQNGTHTYSSISTVNFLTPDFIASTSGSTANISLDYVGGHIAQTNQPEAILGNWIFNNGVTSTNLNLTNNTNQIVLGTGNQGTISLATLTGNRTYTFPDATGTVCLTSGNCIGGGGGGLGGSGTTNFIAKFTPDGNHAGNSSIYDNGQVDIGSTNPVGLFNVDGAQSGRALVVFNQTGDQNILTASASGVTKLTLDTTGNLNIAGGYQIGGNSVISSNSLGTGVLTSSLTTVGALASGSIANGFGTIATGNTITGTTINGTTGINTGAGAGTQRIDTNGNLVNIVGLSSNLNPTTTNTYSIGTSTANQLANLYSNAIFQNGNQVCDLSGNCSGVISSQISAAQLWSLLNGALVPNNTTADLLLGGTSTSSAKFAFINVNSGTPTASITGTLGGIYLTAAGNLGTTNGQSLIFGGGGTGNIVLSGFGTGVLQSVGGVLGISTVTNAELQNSSVTVNTGTGLSGGGLLSLGGTLNLANTGVLSIAGTTNQIIASSGTGAITLSLPQSIDTSALPTFAGETLSSLNGNNAVVYGTTGTGALASASTNTAGLCLQSGASTPTWGACSSGGGATGPLSPFQSVGPTIQETNTTQDLLLGGTSTASAQFAVIDLAAGTPIATLSAPSTGTGLAFNSTGSIQSLNNGTLTVGGNTTGNILLNPDNGKDVSIGTSTPSALLTIGENLYGAPSTNGAYLALSPSLYTDNTTPTSGTVNLMAFSSFGAPTLSSINTSVTTNHAATVAIAGAPQTGANERIQNPYALDVQSGNSAFGGGINLTGSSNTTIGTAVEGLWPLNGNTFTYKDTMNVSNTDIGTLPIGYEVTDIISGNQAALIYNNSRQDEQDFRIGYAGTTEIARNVTTFNSTSIIFTFQLQATIAVGASSSNYAIYYDNPLVTSGAPIYNAGFQYDSLDNIAGNWNSSDQVQFPVSQETGTIFEGTGSLKTIATVDNLTNFSTTSQNPLDAAISNFGSVGANVGTTNYLYTLGGSTDGTAANARSTVFRTSVNGTTGNVAAGTTNANSLPSPIMDNASVMYTPQINGGTGVDGTLDLSKGGSVGGCIGQGLSWSGSTCTLVSHILASAGPNIGLSAGAEATTSFQVPSGINSGKFLIISGSQTEIYDPATNTYSSGPNLVVVAGNGIHSFQIPSGSNAGKFLIIPGGSTATEIYDPATNTFSSGPSLGGTATGVGSHSFQIPSGGQAGNFLTVLGGFAASTVIYNPSTNTYSAGPAFSGGVNAADGAHSFQIPSGSNAGKFITVLGNARSTTQMYDPSTNTYSVGPALPVAENAGSHSFQIPSGSNAGKILTILAGSPGTSDIFDPSTNTYSAGPGVGTAVITGAYSFQIPSGSNAGKFLTNTGGTIEVYDPATNTFSTGPTIGATGAGTYFQISSGSQSGKIFTVAGGGTQIYDSTSNTFTTGPNLGAQRPAGDGSNSFVIPSGPQAGKILTIAANSTIGATAIYDPSTNTYGAGPALGAVAGTGSHNFTIPSGSNAGKILVVLGGNTGTTEIYDPSTNTFSTGPVLGGNAQAGSHSFIIPSGSQAGKILTIIGGSASTTRIYDPSTNTYGTGPTIGGTPTTGANSILIPSGPQAGKILTMVGGGTTSTLIYDPSTNTFGGGPSDNSGCGIGCSSILIPIGSNAGKILIVAGTGTATAIYNPATNTMSTGPVLANNMGAGGKTLPIVVGGVPTVMVIHGNNSSVTSIYDFSSNTFYSGPNLVAANSTGSHSIIIPSGIYKNEILNIVANSTYATQLLNTNKGSFNFTTINIPNGTTLTQDAGFADNSGPHIATMSATGNVTIGGMINLIGLGYAGNTTNGVSGVTGYGPGGGGSGVSGNNIATCGGSYMAAGGTGSGNNCSAGHTYTQDDSGSGGGGNYYNGGQGYGGAGGGAIAINSIGTINITSTGAISVKGAPGVFNPNNGQLGTGGGSGGLIHLTAQTILNNGSLDASGGIGGPGSVFGGGGGGGGKILLSYTSTVTSGTITTNGGTATSGGSAGSASAYIPQGNPPTIYSLGGQNTSGTAQTTISQAGVSLTDGSIGTFSGAANPLPQALYGLTATTVASGSSVYLYAIGGNNGTSDQTTVYNIPVSSTGVLGVGTTTGQAQLTTGISHHATVTGNINGNSYIWVIGGENGITGQNTIYKGTINNVGNIASLTTSGQATLPTPLYGEQAFFQTVGNNNYIYILGGSTTGGAKQTNVYKAVLDGSGNVTSVSTLGQYTLGTATSNFGIANFTDNSGNNDAYILGGFTTGTQSTIQKAIINSDQTGYNVARTNFAPTDLSNMNDITFWVNASLAGTYMTMDINTGTSGSPNWQQCNFNSAPNFTIPSTNTWDRMDCNITPISGRTAVTGARIRVAVSQTQPFTTYFDDFEAKTSASTLTSSALVLAQSLGNASLDLNGQGNGSVNVNYDSTNALAGTGGFTVYNGGNTALMTLTSAGSLGLGTATPTATLNVVGNSGTTPVASFSGQTSSAGLVVDNSGTGDLFTASSGGITRFVLGQTGNLTTAGSASIAGALTFASTPLIQSTNNQSLTFGGATTGNIIFNPQNSTAGAQLLPGAAGTVDLGSAALPFRSLYVNNIITGSSGVSGYFQRNGGALASSNTTDDFLTGSAATTSAIIRLPGVTNQSSFFNLGTGNFGIGTTNPAMATLDVRGNNANLPGEMIAANTAASGLLVDNKGTGNIFTASVSGVSKFTIANNGNVGIVAGGNIDALTSGTLGIGGTTATTVVLGRSTQTINLPGYASGNNSVLYADSTSNGVLSKVNTSSAGLCLMSGASTPTWGACGSVSPFLLSGGMIQEVNNTQDLLLGGTSTAAANFAFINVNSGTPTASISADNGGGAVFLTAAGNLTTTRNQSLTFGGSSNGDILLAPLNGITGAYIAPTTNNQVDLGTVGQTFRNVYGNTFFSGTNQGQTVGTASCVTTVGGIVTGSASCPGGTFNPLQSVGGTIVENNTTQDLLIGGLSTASADFAFINVNSGTPTASIAGTTGAIYLTATGNLATTANQSLSLGGATSGNILLAPENGGAGAYIAPTTNNQVDLGLSSQSFRNIFGNTYYSGSNAGQTIASAACVTTNGGIVTGTGPCPGGGGGGGGGAGPLTTFNGAIVPFDTTQDLLLGGTATASSKFGILNIGLGTPTASLSALTGTGISLTADGSMQSIQNGSLKIGGTTTGNILLAPLNGIAGAFIAPTTNNQVDLGTVGQTFRNVYGNIFFSGTNQGQTVASASCVTTIGGIVTGTGTCPGGGGGSGPFQTVGGTIQQLNNTQDFLLGATSTASAHFAVLNTNGDIVQNSSDTTGTAALFNANSITTGNVASISANALTTGTGLSVYSSSTVLAAGGALGSFNWNPSGGTVSSGDLLDLNVGAGGTLANIFNVSSGGSSLFSVSQTQITANEPVNFTNSGDVSMAYDLNFTNPLASTIKSSALLNIYAGDVFNSSPLTLGTYNAGNVYIDSQALVALQSATVSGQLVVGTSVAPNQMGEAYITNSTTFGQALLTLNQTENVDIFTASSSGTPVFRIDNSGNTRIAASLCVKATLSTACSGSTAGTIYATATTITGADYAENYVSSQQLVPGELVAIANDGNDQAVVAATQDNEDQIIGVVSTNPGVTINSGATTDSTHQHLYPIALVGRVPVSVSTANGNISAGDFLTASDVPGVAVKATAIGAVVGRALDSYTASDPSQVGTITVAANVNWYDPETIATVSEPPTATTSANINAEIAALQNTSGESAASILELQQSLASQSAFLETLLQNPVFLNATASATIASSQSLDLQDATLSGQLQVLGKTTLNDLGVTGMITAGLITVDGLNGSIDSIGQPLQIQSAGVSSIQLENKQVIIATNGDITTTGTITAKEITTGKLNVNTVSTLGASVGQATLAAGQTSVTINTNSVTGISQIFVTSKSNIAEPLNVISSVPGKSFTVGIKQAQTQNIIFSWWVVN